MKRNSRKLGSVIGCWALVFWCSSLPAQDKSTQDLGARDNIFKILDWAGYDVTTPMEDGTSLYGYIAETSSLPPGPNDAAAIKAEQDLVIRLTFLPRFECSPLIELIGTLPENTNASNRVASVRNFNKLDLEIDEEKFQFPVIVEEKTNAIHSFLSANLQRRTSIRILLELGNRSVVTFDDGTKTRFSLEGSRDSISQALGRCRNHK